MSKAPNYTPGGDAQAIQRIANEYYGGYSNMFENHGWPERSEKILPSVQSHVVETYGSVKAFEAAHPRGELMHPMEAIKTADRQVWLKSFYGFDPEAWGFVGFSEQKRRTSFVNRSKPGVLVVIYGASKSVNPKDVGKVIGVLQCSHQLGTAQQFMSPAAWLAKEGDPDRKGKWDWAVKVTRAWCVTPETRMDVAKFSPETYSAKRAEVIGSQGMPLEVSESINILKLGLQEVEVYGETAILASASGTAKQILAPSKAGPVSQNSYVVREAEGPKHLYILKLTGDADAFLGKPVHGKVIIKAGFSKSPETRRDDHNRTLPRGAFEWEVLFSGEIDGAPPHPSSKHAKAGERAMQVEICKNGESLGGEFFLVDANALSACWKIGNTFAKEYFE